MSKEESPFFRLTAGSKKTGQTVDYIPKFTFPPPEISAQEVEKKKAEPKTPHFLSLNQDIVAWSQEKKCGLKYDI
jgi:hypothetical protein